MEAQTLLDLKSIRRENRVSAWSDAVPSLFPGMSLEKCTDKPSVGLVQRIRIAAGRAWLINSSPVKVVYSPRHIGDRSAGFISLMLQLRGVTRVGQGRRDCDLEAGALCLLDNQEAFQLAVGDSYSRMIVLQLPRAAVLAQHPHFEDLTASRFAGDDASSQLLKRNLLNVLSATPRLAGRQQGAALASLVQLLGILEPPADFPHKPFSWRVTRALSLIEEDHGASTLTADFVAEEQGISRRQLDRMFLNETGKTITARIWERRLVHAAARLRNPAFRDRTITEIALDAGFEDPAHFTRAFKKQHGMTPREWRKKGFPRDNPTTGSALFDNTRAIPLPFRLKRPS